MVCCALRVITCLVSSDVLGWKILCCTESATVFAELLEPQAVSTLSSCLACLQVHLGGLIMDRLKGILQVYKHVLELGLETAFTCKCSRKSGPLHIHLGHHTWKYLPLDREVASEGPFLSVSVPRHTDQCCSSEEAAACQSPSPWAAVSKHSQPECRPSPWQPEQRTCFLSQLCFPFCVISHLCCKVP